MLRKKEYREGISRGVSVHHQVQKKERISCGERHRINMSSMDLKSIRVIEFTGKTSDWEGWSEKFKARAKRKKYKNMLIDRETIPTESKYQGAIARPDTADSKDIKKRSELNEEAFEDSILSINHMTKQGKVTFSLVKNCKSSDYPEGNCKLAWPQNPKTPCTFADLI